MRLPEHADLIEQRVSLGEGFEMRNLESRVVENALGGPMLVVSGDLVNSGVGPRALEGAIAVTLEGPDGAAFEDGRVLMSPTPAREELRELDPAHLRSRQDHAARTTAYQARAPGSAVSFSAIFDGVPGAATAFSLDRQRVPRIRPPTVEEPVAPAEGESPAELEAGPLETATALPSRALLSGE